MNNLVEQEVKCRLFEEKLERERLRKQERERDKQDREREIQRLKSKHEREMNQLKAKLEQRLVADRRKRHYGYELCPHLCRIASLTPPII